ncbi:MAG: hypothetical protein ACREBC_00165 [Pyrinomonadaceae bacterium]
MANRFTGLLAAALIISIACVLLTVHIRADTPAGLSSDHGTYVDEGYKTLAVRNLVLFGTEKWHPADTYPGWLKASPLTQWSYYLSFLASQADIAAARVVTIVYYALFLVLYVFLLYGRYSPAVFYGGLLLFSLESTLFFFSRIALFEIPMATLFYALVMSFIRIPETKSNVAIFCSLVVAAILAFSIKKSALVYFGPVFLAIGISLLNQHNFVISARLARYSIALMLGVVILLGLTYGTWSSRLDLGSHSYVSRLMERSPSHTAIPPFWHGAFGYLIRLMDNPLLKVSPFLVLAGIFCAAHGVLCQPSHYLKNLYRLTLMCLVILGPIVLALFKIHPLRYYVPFLPASILISLEWLSFRKVPCDLTKPSLVRTVLTVFLLMLFISYCVVALDVEDKINIMSLMNVMLLGITVAFIVWLIWVLRRFVFSEIASLPVVLGLLALGLTQSLVRVGDFLANPSFAAEQVRHELVKKVNSDEVIAGDWAPFFALGTPIRALYSTRAFNTPSALLQIKPQYFLHSESGSSMYQRNSLQRQPGISLGSPYNLGTYNGSKVTLYSLRYVR